QSLAAQRYRVIVDLHTHSTHSDGILSAQTLMSRAKSRGVDIIALTDHGTLSGVEEARLAATELGLTLIPGIELSSLWGKTGVHIVGLGIDTCHPALLELVRNQQLARQQRNEQIAGRLEQVGLQNVLSRAQALANGGQL